jgi:hypothetical protein
MERETGLCLLLKWRIEEIDAGRAYTPSTPRSHDRHDVIVDDQEITPRRLGSSFLSKAYGEPWMKNFDPMSASGHNYLLQVR